MSIKEKVHQLVDELSPEDLRVVARMLQGLKEPVAEPDAETRAWLDAELVRDLPPYDWNGIDPLTIGEAVCYEPGTGWVAEGSAEA